MNRFKEYQQWKNWSDEAFGELDRVEERYFAAELSASGVDIARRQNVLELGFGNGGFAEFARSRGWTYVGTELDPELVKRAKAAGFEAYEADVPLKKVAAKRRFDIIVAFDVLEHLTIEENVELLGAIREYLASDGRFVARVPSGDSPFGRAIQYGDLTHRTVIGYGIVQQLCIATGFSCEQIRAPAFPVTALGLRRGLRRAAVRVCRAIVRTFIQLVYFDNQPRVVEPNMVVVLKRNAPEDTLGSQR